MNAGGCFKLSTEKSLSHTISLSSLCALWLSPNIYYAYICAPAYSEACLLSVCFGASCDTSIHLDQRSGLEICVRVLRHALSGEDFRMKQAGLCTYLKV